MNEFKKYQKKATSFTEMRPHVPGEDLSGVSVSPADQDSGALEVPGGMIARNPDNHNDQWYVAEDWFRDHYEPMEE